MGASFPSRIAPVDLEAPAHRLCIPRPIGKHPTPIIEAATRSAGINRMMYRSTLTAIRLKRAA